MANLYDDPLRRQRGGGGFNRHAAGNRSYGGGRPYPNTGKGGADAKRGYTERDARRRAIIKRQEQQERGR